MREGEGSLEIRINNDEIRVEGRKEGEILEE